MLVCPVLKCLKFSVCTYVNIISKYFVLTFNLVWFLGALVNAAKTHETALHVAVREDYLDIAEVLIQYGANIFASNNQNKLPIDLVPAESERIYNLLRHHSGIIDFFPFKCSAVILIQIWFCLFYFSC